MGIVEKEGGLHVFDTDILNTFFFFFPFLFLLTAEIITQLTGKIRANLPTAEGLRGHMSKKWTFFKELTPHSRTYELRGQGKKK